MSADEDTELRDLVAQTLEANGTLGKLRAQLRASVFLALEDQEKGQTKSPFLNKELQGFLNTREGKLTVSLIQECLECLGLEFTLAVFKPETGMNEWDKRSDLMTELNIQSSNAQPGTPLLTYLLNHRKNSAANISAGSGDGLQIAKKTYKDLSQKQIADAKEKFEQYDKDNSGSIDKDELRSLFLDMFPSFHRNMLERYVNDEFNATDRNLSSSIDFNEFLDMYRRLFLLCQTVVATDVEEIISPVKKATGKKDQQQTMTSAPGKPITSSSKVNPHSNNGSHVRDFFTSDNFGGSFEEDPFFDDNPLPEKSFSTLSSELEKGKEMPPASKLNGINAKEKGKQSGSSMSSLDGLPALNTGKSTLAGAPHLGRPKSASNDSYLNDSEIDKNLRAVDIRMIDLGLDSQNEEFEYEEDFVQDHSLSQKTTTNSKADGKPEDGSIAEEVDDEDIEDVSIEADDLSRSEKSGFDGITTDCSVSQADGGFDYAEDPIRP